MDTLHYTTEQYLFDRNIFSIGWVLKLLFRSLVYLPLLTTGYYLSTLWLNKQEAAVWITATLGLAYAVFGLLYFLKGMLIALLNARHFLWIPFALVCVGLTCVAPGYVIFHCLEKYVVTRMETNTVTLITWAVTIAFGGYTYSRYKFLSDTAPFTVVLFYRAGQLLAGCFV